MKFELEQAIPVLRRTPVTLKSLLLHLPDQWLVQNEGPETWSPYDILGHLIHAEHTDWIPRVKIILEHGEARAFEPFNRLAMFNERKITWRSTRDFCRTANTKPRGTRKYE